MSFSDPVDWFGTGGLVEARVAELERHLRMLEALRVEVELVRPALLDETGSEGWRSTAADRYAERVALLRSDLRGAETALVEAEAALRAEVDAGRARLADLAAAAAEPRTTGAEERRPRREGAWATD